VGKFALLKGSVIVATIMTLEEFSQYFIKTRTFDLGDLSCDYVGIFVFGYLALWACRKKVTF
jgi:VanZ family protein